MQSIKLLVIIYYRELYFREAMNSRKLSSPENFRIYSNHVGSNFTVIYYFYGLPT